MGLAEKSKGALIGPVALPVGIGGCIGWALGRRDATAPAASE